MVRIVTMGRVGSRERSVFRIGPDTASGSPVVRTTTVIFRPLGHHGLHLGFRLIEGRVRGEARDLARYAAGLDVQSHFEGLPDNVGIAAEPPLPEAVAQNEYRLRLGAVVALDQCAT